MQIGAGRMPPGSAMVRVGEEVMVSIMAWRDDNGWQVLSLGVRGRDFGGSRESPAEAGAVLGQRRSRRCDLEFLRRLRNTIACAARGRGGDAQ